MNKVVEFLLLGWVVVVMVALVSLFMGNEMNVNVSDIDEGVSWCFCTESVASHALLVEVGEGETKTKYIIPLHNITQEEMNELILKYPYGVIVEHNHCIGEMIEVSNPADIIQDSCETEMGYDAAVLEMSVSERMPDAYFPTLLKFNDSFLKKYGGKMVRYGYVFVDGVEDTKLVGYEETILFKKEKPTKAEIDDSLLIHKCLRYERDTCREGNTAHFEITALKICEVTIKKVGEGGDYNFCSYNADGRYGEWDCMRVSLIDRENKVFCRPTDKIALVNSTGFVTNITIPFHEKMTIWVGGER